MVAGLPPGHSAADLHLHTTYSDGRAAPVDVLNKAIEIGLSVIAITDHDRIDGAVLAAAAALGTDCEVVIGEEISSAGGHVAGLFLKSAVPPGLSVAATIAAIHEQGGLAVAVHPFYRLGGARGVGPAAAGLAWDAIEVENASPGTMLANRRARQAQASWARAATGGSDAHILPAVGAAVTVFPGRSAADLRHALENGMAHADRDRPNLGRTSLDGKCARVAVHDHREQPTRSRHSRSTHSHGRLIRERQAEIVQCLPI